MKNVNILITGAGGPAAICAYKSLAKEYYKIHMGDMDPLSAGLYFVEEECRHMLLPASHEEYLKNLFNVCLENKIDVLIPTVDAELIKIAGWKEQFEVIGTKVLVNEARVLQICMNKHVLLDTLKRSVEVGQFDMLSEADEVDWKGKEVIIKPISGSGSRGVVKFSNFADIPETLRNRSGMLIQEFHSGIEYSVDVMITQNGELKVVAPRQRLRTDSGISITGRIVNHPEIVKYVKKIIHELDLVYGLNIQVVDVPNEGIRLIEINPRFSGGLSLAIEAGANTPYMCVRDILNFPVAKIYEVKELAMVRSYTETYMRAQDLMLSS